MPIAGKEEPDSGRSVRLVHSLARQIETPRRRHQPQAQAFGKTKRRQEADESHRQRQHPAEAEAGTSEGRRMGEQEAFIEVLKAS